MTPEQRWRRCSSEQAPVSGRDNRLRGPLSMALQGPLNDWRPIVGEWQHSAAGRALEAFVDGRVAQGEIVYPDQVLRALELTPLARTRVVIVGQDPYHAAGQAEGLAFSVPRGVRPPPSLRNILRELQRDCRIAAPSNGHLGAWAAQGVLLLNATLTVEDARPGIHANHGWEALTDDIIEATIQDLRPKAFMLWGACARRLGSRIGAQGRHLVLQASHPSPLSAARGTDPFIGCGHFGEALAFLATAGDLQDPLDWSLS